MVIPSIPDQTHQQWSLQGQAGRWVTHTPFLIHGRKELTLQGVPKSFLVVIPDSFPTTTTSLPCSGETGITLTYLIKYTSCFPADDRFPLLKLPGPTFRQSGVIVHGGPITE